MAAVGNLIYDYNHKTVEVWAVPAGTLQNTVVLDPAGGRAGVTLTAAGGTTKTFTLTGTDTSLTMNIGGQGLLANEAPVALSGTWQVPVTGASASTALGTKVYAASDGTLTTTATGNVYAGIVQSRLGSATAAATLVKIGA